MADSKQTQRELMTIARDVLLTTGTPGWRHILTLAAQSVHSMERAAIDEEDDGKGAILRREAKAARAFLEKFLNLVETSKQFSTGEESLGDSEEFVTREEEKSATPRHDSNPL